MLCCLFFVDLLCFLCYYILRNECGFMTATEICRLIDNDLIAFIHKIFVVIKIGVPVLLIILGMLDLGKGVVASKEDEIKKGQQIFIKRLVAAILVFFVVTIVQLVMNFASPDDGSFWTCANQILNGIPNRSVFDNTTIKSDSSVECTTIDNYNIYQKCLEDGNAIQTCSIIFDGICEPKDSIMLIGSWPMVDLNNYANSYMDEHKISCSGSSGEQSYFLKRRLYSCVVETKAGNTEDEKWKSCVDFMVGFCSYK